MDPYDPSIADDKKTSEERLADLQRLSERGIVSSDLDEAELDDLRDDLRSDRTTNKEMDGDDGLSDVVSPEEVDGND